MAEKLNEELLGQPKPSNRIKTPSNASDPETVAKKTPAKSDTAMVNTSTSMTPTKKENPAISMVDPALAQAQAQAATSQSGLPRGREENITGQGKEIYKRGEGLGTGPVGNADGYVGRPVPDKTEEPDDQAPNTGAGGNIGGNTGGVTVTVGGQTKPREPNDVTLTKENRTNVIPGVVPFLDKDGTQIGYLHGEEARDDNGNLIGYYRDGQYTPIKKSTSSTSTTTAGGGAASVDLGEAPKAPETPDLKPLLDQWRAAAEEQQQAKIDYATRQGIDELTRAEEDAQVQFRNAQEQIAAEEMAARDNQALYAEARGDKGGIGAAQYDSIANTAAINRQSVKDAQTKLSTDTARQIADLRAKGEFDKADAVLEIAQTYLSNLMSLEQWAANYGLSAAQFEESIREWEANFEKSVGEMMGEYKGKQTLSARNADRNFELQESGVTGYYGGSPTYTREKADRDTANSRVQAYLSAGIMPDDATLSASDYTPELAQATLMAAKAKTGSGGSGSGGGVVSDTQYEPNAAMNALFTSAGKTDDPEGYIAKNAKSYGLAVTNALFSAYRSWNTETNPVIGNYAQALAANLKGDGGSYQYWVKQIEQAVATGHITSEEGAWVAQQLGIN